METDIHTGLNSAIVTAQGMKLDAYVCLARSEYGCTGLIHPKGGAIQLGLEKNSLKLVWPGSNGADHATLPVLRLGFPKRERAIC